MQHTAWKDFNTGVWIKPLMYATLFKETIFPMKGRFLPCWSSRKNDKIMGSSNEALRGRT